MPHCFRVLFFSAALLAVASVAQAQFTLGGDVRVNPDDFSITTFASDLNYPVGMAELADGSVMVAVSNGTAFFSSTSGQILRLADTDGDGVADERTVLVERLLGGGPSALRLAGDLVAVTGQGAGKPISILRLGETPTDPLIPLGNIFISYSGNWLHPHSALALRQRPGQPGTYELVFHLGSEVNFAKTQRTLSLTSTIGVEGQLSGDSVFMITLTDDGENVTGSDLTHLATGLRSGAGYAFHPVTGDLYIQDNGIDGLSDVNEAHSADEINVIEAAQIGGAVEDFGFPDNYIRYRTGEFVGGAGIAPLVAFLPVPDPATGDENEGPNEIAFAPSGFPPGLNNGLFVGFHGKFSRAGVANEENPLVYVDLDSGEYFHFIGVNETGVGHLDGLLATERDLYVADISPSGGFGGGSANTGVIYRIRNLYTAPTAVEEISALVPTGFALAPATPNPFNPETSIEFTVPQDGANMRATLKVYDSLGQLVATLNDAPVNPGRYRARWDGRNTEGQAVSSGVYFYRLQVGERFSATRRMTLLK
jgi:glucose/arabinose dehydrogenase